MRRLRRWLARRIAPWEVALLQRETVQMAAAMMAVEGQEVIIEQARFGSMTGVDGERLMTGAETLYNALDADLGITA